jgi:hypothetical protein
VSPTLLDVVICDAATSTATAAISRNSLKYALSAVRCRTTCTQDTDIGGGSSSSMITIIMTMIVQVDVDVDETTGSFFGERNAVLLQEFLFQNTPLLRQTMTRMKSNIAVDTCTTLDPQLFQERKTV